MQTNNSGQTAHIGDYQSRVDYALGALAEQAFTRRLAEKDATLWKQGPEGIKVINNRLGWINIAEVMQERTAEINSFVNGITADGFTHAVLMGMGGSSLSPEVSRLTFGIKPGHPNLTVLDTTDAYTLIETDEKIDPAKTLFIVATKSGTTVETLSAYEHYYEMVKKIKGDKVGKNFIAITDPGTPLETETKEKNFRQLFTNFGNIGGRYSALSYFGLIPAAVIGVDIDLLLKRAIVMSEMSAPGTDPADSPGVALGTIMAELAMEGRNKLTLLMSPEIGSFGYWVEQLVAESTGKNGTGIIPVEDELPAAPEHYGDDRLFVYMRLSGGQNDELDAIVKSLEHTGQPVVQITLDDVYDLGQEYLRWEIATATACALLGVNAFDELNVKESKDNTNRLLEEFRQNGKLPEEAPVVDENGIKLFCDDITRSALDTIRTAGPYSDDSMLSYIAAHLDQFQPGNYFALMAFIRMSPKIDGIFQCMRGHIRDAFDAATTLGYGPRFLHSTGQLHKGGPNTGIFIQFTADDVQDVPIPGQQFGFSVLKQAQAMGDAIALQSKGCRLIRIHLGADIEGNLNKVLDLIHQAVTEQSQD
ncbi:MAG: hypothetical protein ACYC27_15110 [Armatimonadota bacterium]